MSELLLSISPSYLRNIADCATCLNSYSVNAAGVFPIYEFEALRCFLSDGKDNFCYDVPSECALGTLLDRATC